ncbi:MAG: bifunctional nuclease family protein [Deltaproteobacteria bacterium]|nr:bifunctional nuclease family protein [Deltaproteobacteria bacterium]
MKVHGMTVDPFTNSPIVVLKDLNNEKAVPIWIGLVEASAIAMELEHMNLPRPMTHDLLKNVIDKMGGKVTRVEVCDIKDNTFYGLVHIEKDGHVMEIDSRPSDAIALALRAEAPIFVAEHVIEKSRYIKTEEGGEPAGDEEKKKKELLEMLENMDPDDFGKYKM